MSEPANLRMLGRLLGSLIFGVFVAVVVIGVSALVRIGARPECTTNDGAAQGLALVLAVAGCAGSVGTIAWFWTARHGGRRCPAACLATCAAVVAYPTWALLGGAFSC